MLHQFLQSCEAIAHPTTLQNQYTVLKMRTWIMQIQQLLEFSRFSSQHLEEFGSDLLGGLTDRKKSNLSRKSVLTKRIKRQLLDRVNRNPKFRLSDLLLTARRLVSNATSYRFLKNRSIRNRVAVQDVLPKAQKDRRVNWCHRHFFVDFTSYFQRRNLISFDLVRNSEEFTFTEKLVKNFTPI